MRFPLLALLAASAALAGISAVYAQDIQIIGLYCTGDPEIVVIKNNGSAPQDMMGWTLRSDPETSQVFDLSVVGSLPAGEGISVFSGPTAPPTDPPKYRWTTEYVYRDMDPTDYARVVNGQGSEVDQRNCPAVEPTITPTSVSAVGGVAELPDVSGSPAGTYAALAGAAVAAVMALAAGAWYARRRWLR